MIQGIKTNNGYEHSNDQKNSIRDKKGEAKSFEQSLDFIAGKYSTKSNRVKSDKYEHSGKNFQDKDVKSPKEATSNLEDDEANEEFKNYIKNLVNNPSALMELLNSLKKDNSHVDLMKMLSLETFSKVNNLGMNDLPFDANEMFSEDNINLIKNSLNNIQNLLDKVSSEEFTFVNESTSNNLEMEIINKLIAKGESKGNSIEDLLGKLKENYLEEGYQNKSNLVNAEAENKFGENKNPLNLVNSEEDKELNLLKDIIGEKEINKDFTKSFMINQSLIDSNVTSQVQGSENLIANKSTIVQDIIKSVKFMENNNMKELIVKINPKELGQIVITLVLEADKMNAKIMANNKEAYSLLNSNLKDLKNGLSDVNLKVDQVQVGIFTEDFMSYSNLPQGFFESEFQKEQSRNRGKSEKMLSTEEAITEEDNVNIIKDGKINILA